MDFLLLYLSIFEEINIDSFKKSSIKELNYHFENDFIFQTDRYYTHAHKLEAIFKHRDVLYSFNLKQSMFTPKEHKLDYVEYGDMPYSGIATFDTGVHKYTDNSLLSIDIGVGYIGKYSYAKESMEIIHSLLPANPEFNGWHTQHYSKALFRLSSSYKYKKRLKYTSIIFNNGFNIGNLQSSLYSDVELIVGKTIADNFGLYSTYSNNINFKNLSKENFNFIIGCGVEHIFNDIRLNASGISMIKDIIKVNFGFITQYSGVDISYLATIESKRFTTQDNHYFKYSDITIGWKF